MLAQSRERRKHSRIGWSKRQNAARTRRTNRKARSGVGRYSIYLLY
jgi:hypothetical protein